MSAATRSHSEDSMHPPNGVKLPAPVGLAKLLAGVPHDAAAVDAGDPLYGVYTYVTAHTNGAGPMPVFDEAIASRSDAAAIRAAVFAVDPSAPVETAEPPTPRYTLHSAAEVDLP